jgi:RimJ/RimL family protein N-acetyltransferase
MDQPTPMDHGTPTNQETLMDDMTPVDEAATRADRTAEDGTAPAGGMRCVRDRSAAEFATLAWDFLVRDPVRNNVLCTLVEAGCQEEHRDWEWLRVLDGQQRLVGVAARTPPRGLLLSDLPAAGAAALATLYARTDGSLASVGGPVTAATAFARRYAAILGRSVRPGMATRLFRLDRVDPPAAVPGRARPAERADRDLVLDWIVAFSAEMLTDDKPRDEQATSVDRRFDYRDLMWLWEVDGVPVSFAWRSPLRPPGRWPRTPVTRISAVYTPPDQRGHGYASANVAQLSQRGLDAGAEACMLYTDRANPTSNKIYQRIGYRPVGEAREWCFS